MQVPEIKYPVYFEVLKQILIEEGLSSFSICVANDCISK